MKVDSRLLNSFTKNGQSMPTHTAGAISRYLFYGAMPGGFLESMFCGELNYAVFKADVENKKYFCDIAKWIEWYAPKESKGNLAKMIEWCKLTDDERREILVRNNLAHSIFEVLKSESVTSEEIND